MTGSQRTATKLKSESGTQPAARNPDPIPAPAAVQVKKQLLGEGGESIDEFLAGFPTVKREQVIGLIEAAKENLLALV